MDARDADIVDGDVRDRHRDAHLGGLLGDGQVARARGGHDDMRLARPRRGGRGGVERDGAGGRVHPGFRKTGRDRRGLIRLQSRDEDGGARFAGLGRDRDDLIGGLALAEDHLAQALPETTVMINLGEAEVGRAERPAAQVLQRLVGGARAGADVIQKLAEFRFAHDVFGRLVPPPVR